MSLAQEQRHELMTTLRGLSDDQWRAETLCAGWDAEDLVAHLVVRERDPLAAAGSVFGGRLAAHQERRMAARRAQGREHLLDMLAAGPTWWMAGGPLDVSQAVEDWIHHEDVRRGGAGLPPRGTAPTMAEPLWRAALRFGRVTLARTPLEDVRPDGDRGDGDRGDGDRGDGDRGDGRDAASGQAVVVLTDGDRAQALRIGAGRMARRTDEAPDVTLAGPAGELVLFASGRPADVEMDGDDRLVRALAAARRSV